MGAIHRHSTPALNPQTQVGNGGRHKYFLNAPKILFKFVLTNLYEVFKLFLYRIEGLNAFLRYIASPKLHDTGLFD